MDNNNIEPCPVCGGEMVAERVGSCCGLFPGGYLECHFHNNNDGFDIWQMWCQGRCDAGLTFGHDDRDNGDRETIIRRWNEGIRKNKTTR